MPKNWLGIFIAASLAATAAADVTLPPLISDGMVLQSDMPAPIWGTAAPGEKVTVTFAGQTLQTAADADGNWRVALGALKPAAADILTVRGNNQLTVRDVLVGEVWLASGQSNMEAYLYRLEEAQEVMAEPYAQIRLFIVEKEGTLVPARQVKGKWVKAAPKPPGLFSAVGYLFARGLHQRTHAPVGVIQSTWGGTLVPTWMSEESLQSKPEFAPRLKKLQANDDGGTSLADFSARNDAWKANPQLKKPVWPCELPSRLHNGMIRPIAPYALRGVLWYQGESDAYLAQDYRLMFPAMIQDWRKTWGQDRLHFLFVQLPNYMKPVDQQPMRSFWAEQREAQTAALALPDVGMIVTIDIGEENIHPKNKKDVADRLLRLALAQVYGQKIAYKAPSFASIAVEGSTIRVRFNDAQLGLKSRDGQPIKSFAIAGGDRKFAWADAKIEGDSIVVSSEQVKQPVAVRYAYQENPPTNLVSNDDLPVSPFRTDNWQP